MNTKQERLKINSVKGDSSISLGGPSLGRFSDELQVKFDRHRATAERNIKQHLRAKWKKKTFRIATWNVRTLLQKGKLDNVIAEMTRMDISILGLAEMRWNDSGQFCKDGHSIIYSGNNNHTKGVGIIVRKDISKNILGYRAFSDRVLLVKLKNLHRNLCIIQAYAPTSDASEEEVTKFYEDLDKALRNCRYREIPIIMGDFNAKVGNAAVEKCVGGHGLGQQNERGTILVEWCQENNLCITNTCFQKHPRKLWTWKSPDSQTRNQIDYIIIPQIFRAAILDVNTYPSADCDSDHNPVVAKFRLRLQKMKSRKRTRKFDWNKCKKDQTIMTEFQQSFATKMNTYNNEATSTEEVFNRIKNSLEAANEIIPKNDGQRHKNWMNPEILQLMEKRRLNKNDEEEYKKINKQVKKACYEAHEKYLNKQCDEIEKKYTQSPKEAHQNIRVITGKYKSTSRLGCLKSKTGEIVMEKSEILERWKEYIYELYDDPERVSKPFLFDEPLSGPEILKCEIEKAIEQTKENKAVGPDEISVEMIKALDAIGLNVLHDLFNRIYNTGNIPSVLTKSIFIALPKKPGATECQDHRTISLMSHLTKIFLRIIMNRMKNKVHFEISEEQYGFMPDKGTRNAVFILKNIAQRTIEMRKDLYLAFIDYRKAFDRVKHVQLLEMLDNIGVDDKDLRIIQNLYFEQSAAIKVDDNRSEWTPIRKGVRQGCVLSPDLFSLYSEIILRSIKEAPGISVGGTNINNLRYADDTVLVADSDVKLQNLINIVNERSKHFGMELNEKKTETMVITKKTKEDMPKCHILVNGTAIKQAQSFKYLGTTITWNAKDDKELNIRVAQAKSAFNQMRPILCNKNLSFKTRYRVLKCYVNPIFVYNSETWTIDSRAEDRINAFEMWTFRRMTRTPWTARKTNEEILRIVDQKRSLLSDIRRRQLQFTGHVFRKGKLEHLSMTGKIEGKRAPGRQRLTYLKQKLFNSRKSCDIIHTSYSRDEWKLFSIEAVDAWTQA